MKLALLVQFLFISNAMSLEIPSNLKFFGYFQSDNPTEMNETYSYTNLVLQGGQVSREKFELAKSLNQKLFVYLEDYLFIRDANGKSSVLPKEKRQANWKSLKPLISQYLNIIEAFVPVDEPEFRQMGPTPAQELEDIANMIRSDFPQAKLAINYWATTVIYEEARLKSNLPKNYDYIGTEQYDGGFNSQIYELIARYTEGFSSPPKIYLIPKAFLATIDPNMSWLPEMLQPFYQPGGEDGLISNHLEIAVDYAKTHPRVFAIIPFLYRTISERNQSLRGANELPKVKQWIKNFGLSFLGKQIPQPTPSPSPSPSPSPTPQPQPPSSNTIVFTPSSSSNRTFIPGCIHGEDWVKTNCEYTGSMKKGIIYSAEIKVGSNFSKNFKIDRAEAGENYTWTDSVVSYTPGSLTPITPKCSWTAISNRPAFVDQIYVNANRSGFFDLFADACIVNSNSTVYINMFVNGPESDKCASQYICRVQFIEY